MATTSARPAAFPARSRTASDTVEGVLTDVMTMSFADKILITISQNGRLAQWVHVPLDNASPDPAASMSYNDDPDAPSSDLLPRADLTATTVLGGAHAERNTVGQLFATQIASAIATKNPAEKRLVVIGMGLEKATLGREAFMDILSLVLGTI